MFNGQGAGAADNGELEVPSSDSVVVFSAEELSVFFVFVFS